MCYSQLVLVKPVKSNPGRTNNISGLLNLTNGGLQLVVATGGALSGVGSVCFLSGRQVTLSQV